MVIQSLSLQPPKGRPSIRRVVNLFFILWGVINLFGQLDLDQLPAISFDSFPLEDVNLFLNGSKCGWK